MPSSPDPPLRRVLDARVIVPDHVAFRAFPNKTVVANLESGIYHELNPTGGRMLEALQEVRSPREAAPGLAKELGQPLGRILDDLAGFIIKLKQQGLIEVKAESFSPVNSPPSTDSTTSLFSKRLNRELLPHLTPLTHIEKTRLIIEILGIYVRTRLRLERNNLKILNEVPRTDLSRAPDLPPEQTAAVAIRLGKAVARTLMLVPTDSRCLIRSLVLLRLISRCGIDSCLVIGVRNEGEAFAAHAWVEHRGIPILDSGGEHFARLLQIETSRAA
jgi:hypothetical protein